MEDQQNASTGTGLASEGRGSAIWQLAAGLYIYVAAVPVWCWVVIGVLTCGITIICCVLWRRASCRSIGLWLKRYLGRCRIFPITEEDLLAIPHPEKNIQRTFVGILSSETADKLKAMFRKNYCPEIVPLIRGTELKTECRLVICCLPQNIRQMYLDDGTVFAKLITDAGSRQAMVLIIIVGEKKISWKTLYDRSIYGSVLQQGQDLYMKGHSQRKQTRSGVSESVALVTVDNRPSKYQLEFMNNFVEGAFTD